MSHKFRQVIVQKPKYEKKKNVVKSVSPNYAAKPFLEWEILRYHQIKYQTLGGCPTNANLNTTNGYQNLNCKLCTSRNWPELRRFILLDWLDGRWWAVARVLTECAAPRRTYTLMASFCIFSTKSFLLDTCEIRRERYENVGYWWVSLNCSCRKNSKFIIKYFRIFHFSKTTRSRRLSEKIWDVDPRTGFWLTGPELAKNTYPLVLFPTTMWTMWGKIPCIDLKRGNESEWQLHRKQENKNIKRTFAVRRWINDIR